MNTIQLYDLLKTANQYNVTLEKVLKLNEKIEWKQYFNNRHIPDFKFFSPEAEQRAYEITKRYIQINHKKLTEKQG